MEKTVNHNDVIFSVLQEATNPGEELAPMKLLTIIEQQADILHMLSNIDRGNILFDAIQQDFGFIHYFKFSDHQLTADNLEKWAALFRWIVQGLENWKTQDDLCKHKLVALFVATAYCDSSGDFWSLLEANIGHNHDLLNTLERLVGSFHVGFSARSHWPEPIWEKEHIEQFNQADANQNWFAVSELWHSLENAVLPNWFLTQCMRCLCRFGHANLMRALSNICQTPVAMQIAESLTIEQRFEIAIESDNAYIQFGCVYKTFFYRPKHEPLSDIEQNLLTKILLKVAQDNQHWKRWMQVFNRYPLRYPAMQTALGNALAKASDPAIQSYIDAINLYTNYNYTGK